MDDIRAFFWLVRDGKIVRSPEDNRFFRIEYRWQLDPLFILATQQPLSVALPHAAPSKLEIGQIRRGLPARLR